MYPPLRVLLILLAIAAPTLAIADQFKYSYTFDTWGHDVVVSGSISGTEIGGFVANPHDATMFINGIQLIGPVVIGRQGDLDPLIAFEVTLNSFYLQGGPSWNRYQFGFWHTDIWPQYVSLLAPWPDPDHLVSGFDASAQSDAWSLTRVGWAAVPDGATSTAMLLGIASLFLACGKHVSSRD